MILGPLMMTWVFGVFTAPGGIFLPGAPFLFAAVLMVAAVIVFVATLREKAPQ